ncbi:MAG: YlbF family regulator [Anaerolineae bacterium]
MSGIAIRDAAQAFAATLRQSAPIADFWQAKARLEENHAAHALLTRLSERQRALALKQRTGDEIAQGDIDDLRRLQRQVQDNPIITAYGEALQQAQLYLPKVNAEISELLGLDFAGLARAASIYCPLP